LRDDPDLAYGFGHQGIGLKLGGVAALRQIQAALQYQAHIGQVIPRLSTEVHL
jgi:hypothetical protein